MDDAVAMSCSLMVFVYDLAADILSLCTTMHYSLQGRMPYKVVCHYTPDISEYVTFSWYKWIYYWDEHSKEKKISRWLGSAHKVGQSLCYYALNEKKWLCSTVFSSFLNVANKM